MSDSRWENSEGEKGLLTEGPGGLLRLLHRIGSGVRDPADVGHLVLCVSEILLAGETRRVALQGLELLGPAERTAEYLLLLLLILPSP